MIIYNYISQIGEIQIVIEGKYIKNITLKEEEFMECTLSENISENIILKKINSQLNEYFLGTRKYFDLPLLIEGTDFQKKVYNVVINTKYGETYSYKDIAQLANSPKAFRAVGSVMRKNNFAIVIPCHRIIKSGGKLGEYFSNRKDEKIKLLLLEKNNR